MAVGVDIRNRDFAVGPVIEQLDELGANPRFALTLMFVDCDDEVLGRRYTETRRRHQLAQGRPVADGIALATRLVAPRSEERRGGQAGDSTVRSGVSQNHKNT